MAACEDSLLNAPAKVELVTPSRGLDARATSRLLLHFERAGSTSNRARHFPNQLSGGEQQRVAIARALLTDPFLFLADEPTGNLDLETSERVFDLMRECHGKRGLTSVIVTHNRDLAARCDRVFEMSAGSRA